MLEFAHHYSWLGDIPVVLEQLEKGAAIDRVIRARLEEGQRTCQTILEQNPASALGRKTLERINSLLNLSPSSQAPQQTQVVQRNLEREKLRQTTAQSMGLRSEDFLAQTIQEHQLEGKIEKFEERFLTYGSNVFFPAIEELPQQTPQEQGLRRALQYPFTAIRNNVVNPLKNVEVAQRIAQKIGLPWNALLLSLQNPDHFAYGPMPEHLQGKIAAGFAPLARMMSFSDSIDLSNEMDMLMILHECLHMPQHARQRQQLEWYLQFYGSAPKPRVILNDEYQTYGLEIEALNLRLDGALRRAAEAKTNGMDRDQIMGALHARPEQWMMVEMLRQLVMLYYPNGDAVSNAYPAPYCDMIKRICVHDGYDVFEIQAGQLVKVNR